MASRTSAAVPGTMSAQDMRVAKLARGMRIVARGLDLAAKRRRLEAWLACTRHRSWMRDVEHLAHEASTSDAALEAVWGRVADRAGLAPDEPCVMLRDDDGFELVLLDAFLRRAFGAAALRQIHAAADAAGAGGPCPTLDDVLANSAPERDVVAADAAPDHDAIAHAFGIKKASAAKFSGYGMYRGMRYAALITARSPVASLITGVARCTGLRMDEAHGDIIDQYAEVPAIATATLPHALLVRVLNSIGRGGSLCIDIGDRMVLRTGRMVTEAVGRINGGAANVPAAITIRDGMALRDAVCALSAQLKAPTATIAVIYLAEKDKHAVRITIDGAASCVVSVAVRG